MLIIFIHTILFNYNSLIHSWIIFQCIIYLFIHSFNHTVIYLFTPVRNTIGSLLVSLLFSHQVVPDSLWSHELRHATFIINIVSIITFFFSEHMHTVQWVHRQIDEFNVMHILWFSRYCERVLKWLGSFQSKHHWTGILYIYNSSNDFVFILYWSCSSSGELWFSLPF